MDDILILGTVGRERVHSFGRTSEIVFGGTGFYAAEAMLKIPAANPLLVSVLGNDLPADVLIEQFSRAVDTRGLQWNDELPSFFWEAEYAHSFEESNTLVLENRLIHQFRPDWAGLRKGFPDLRFCYLAAFAPDVQVACCEHFADAFTLSETLEYWINRDRERVLDAARHSNGFVVTEREFRALWNLEIHPYSPYRLVAQLRAELGLDFLIVTFADRGSQVFDEAGTFFVPALPVLTVDSTGAGNAFSGGLVAQLARSGRRSRLDLLDAVAFGTALAGFQVQEFSNHALRHASAATIAERYRQVSNSISWFEAGEAPI
jgi:sugar/nucleoside kinase (ribokinase family)